MARALIEVLDLPWPDGREAELGLLAIDVEVLEDLRERQQRVEQGLYPCGADGLMVAGGTAEIAKGFGMSEDSYAYSVIRLKDAGLITLRVDTADEESAAGPRGETEQQQ